MKSENVIISFKIIRKEDVMKKKILGIMLAGIMVFSMAACGSSDTVTGDIDDQPSDDATGCGPYKL